MQFVYDDGGRKNAGYVGVAGDCVCRAICIAAQLPYEEVYEALANGMGSQRRSKHRSLNRRSARNGITTSRKWFKDYMRSLGWEYVPTMRIGSGCKVHLVDGELPMGRLIVQVSGHYTAVIDGVIHDLYNSQREVAAFVPDTGRELKAGESRNQNGIFTIQRRCVYGYWREKPSGIGRLTELGCL